MWEVVPPPSLLVHQDGKNHKIRRFLEIIHDGIYLERVYNWEREINFSETFGSFLYPASLFSCPCIVPYLFPESLDTSVAVSHSCVKENWEYPASGIL